MYATPDGGVAATYIDNGSIPIFVLRPSNPDGEMAVYTLSMCSEVMIDRRDIHAVFEKFVY